MINIKKEFDRIFGDGTYEQQNQGDEGEEGDDESEQQQQDGEEFLKEGEEDA